jgi:hypothetical protein
MNEDDAKNMINIMTSGRPTEEERDAKGQEGTTKQGTLGVWGGARVCRQTRKYDATRQTTDKHNRHAYDYDDRHSDT